MDLALTHQRYVFADCYCSKGPCLGNSYKGDLFGFSGGWVAPSALRLARAGSNVDSFVSA